jgi:GTPase Era involved in 16S rRNA processing
MTPVFAVVGHPNKGKSSIVSTIAQNDDIAISPRSGTTRETQHYDILIGAADYTLVDTPGFQRPSRALAWLQEHAPSADKRHDAIQQFIADPQCRQQFPEEVMLLKPIVEGAAILYVVDGSRPYGAEYEAEMEILRWTGQASMALINPIENQDHVQDWQQALGQYFKIVRVFNAMQADFEKVVAILEAFSHIREEWKSALADIVNEYRRQRATQLQESASLLEELLTRLCTYQVSQKVLSKSQADGLKGILEKKYFNDMSTIERQYHELLKRLYQYHHLESTIDELPLEDNLFDAEKWIMWGLNRKQLTVAATIAGATTGAVLDAAAAGSSFMLGAVGGGLLGAGSAWLGADRISSFHVRGLPLGGYEAHQGPIQNRNFPYAVLGRFVYLADALRHRTHAHRERLQISDGDLSARIEQLSSEQQAGLHRALDRLRQQKSTEGLGQYLYALISTDSPVQFREHNTLA